MFPIGVFDSGYGGLTVLKEFVRVLPEYDFVYLGDNARTPYGTRSFDVVYRYTKEAVHALFELGCPLVILACNTASAKALRSIQQRDLPLSDPGRRVLGVIRPSVEAIGKLSANRHVGILATAGTVASGSYPLEIEKLYGLGNYTVTQVACPLWVPLVESNELTGPGVEYFVRKYVDGLFEQDPQIDTVILGCTHYPLLAPQIARFLPVGVQLVEQGAIVAGSLKEYLSRHAEMDAVLGKSGRHTFLTTENAGQFAQMASLFMDAPVSVRQISL
ncbi:MAG: glutamate racemase [Culturomica sp.]|nr:glutamate racemase [Culturomica sp.]